MHICIFQTGEPLHIDDGDYRPMRCILLADKLIENGHKVTIISSAFFHQRKIHRSNTFKQISLNKNLTIHLIPSPGYKKHIGIMRILDHLVLAASLNIFLKLKKDFHPDKIFLGFPPIFTSFIFVKWAIKKNIPLMLDVKDKWPELFIEAFPTLIKPIAKYLLEPYFLTTKYVFRKANKITSITNEYINWIKVFISDFSNDEKYFVSSLTRKIFTLSKSEIFESLKFWQVNGISLMDEKYLCFVGTYSKSFNFNLILKIAIKLEQKFPNIKIVLCGSGDQYEILCNKFSQLSNVIIMGEINKNNAKLLVSNSLATLAPYKNNSNFRDHIPNKIIESLENGIPIITSLEGTLKKMIMSKKNGIFIKDDENINIKNIEKLIEDENYCRTLKENSIKSYKDMFDFNKTYDEIINNLLML